ncbi:MAG: NAD-binding protein [Pseudonocardiaceae bacterium]|nr:NAD-binding protein [Pseudonocardiaceae bacterium]
MGFPMSQRLLAAGYQLVGMDASNEVAKRAEASGVAIAESAAEVADRTDIVLTSLPSPPVVREVALGRNGMVDGSRAGVWIELSTTGAEMIREIAAALADRGVETVDSPVSGGVNGASAGTLAVMAATTPHRFDTVKPILEVLGRAFHVGTEPGLGQTMKLANNYLSATAIAATSEAVVFGMKAGLDPSTMIEVMNAGTGRNSATVDKFPRAVLNRRFDFGFTSGLMYKDLRLLSEQADEMGLPMWVAESVRQLWLYTVNRGGADADFTSLITHLERWAGVEARGAQESPDSSS